MSNIKELSLSEIELVSGGNANGQDAGERSNYGNNNARNTLARNAPRYIYSSPSTINCADNLIIGAAGGAVLGGLPGAAVGAASGAYTGQCFTSGASGNNNGNKAGSSKCSGNNVAGTCNR